MFVVEFIVAAAVPFDAGRDRGTRPAQLVTPARSQVGAATKSLVVGDRTVRLVGLGDPAGDRLLSRVASDIGAAINAVEAFWGVGWSRDISVVAAHTDEEFRAAAGGGAAAQWADIAAVTVVDRVDPAHRVAIGQRIVFAPGAAGMTEGALRIVLTHELFHYAARVNTAPDAPRWLTEGVADFVARPRTPVPADALPVPLTLPSDADLDAPGSQRSLAYDRAWWFARFVADSFGAGKLHDLYLASCGAGHTDVPAAAHAVLATDSSGLLVRWHEWLTHSG
ncbi:hypothetical protein AWC17_02290 [Mycobacterium nebraskense]|uniref:DUF4157 domain-containing protein n=1 Tax=Mycobacterium nebraskense TaxID=244292 RepID=A0A0F5MUZ0_9MYCO|nr:hypothetical protein [Mycobacterium nebraskense]KKB98580.1 hypothetical protein WU83_30680 [Mycobacterium nebraskense]KLO37291.1 hypothetical protein ABW17_21730 [Mycobacterium nebraskense]MCV7118660.1 hypothetical protein [Mycobacterium nebraskense]ORW25081.1 hypothetical protein AWC17_02290 [Mycobacterium nebraskense]